MALDTPVNNAIPFGRDGLKNSIPNSTASEGAASFTQGFPPETMNPLNAGGVPPAGRDFNGILNQLSSHQVWLNAGMIYKFDATLATAIGGYKIGAIVQTDDGLSAYICVTDNNSNNPNSVLTGWMPYAGQALMNATKLAKYDVGDIYITTKVFADAAAVATYFGGGTWEAFGGGTHLSFAGTSDGVTLTANTVSGSHTHEITMAELPADGVGMQFATAASSGVVVPAVNAFESGAFDGLGMQSDGSTYTGKALQKTQNLGDGDPMPIRPRTTTTYAWKRTA